MSDIKPPTAEAVIKMLSHTSKVVNEQAGQLEGRAYQCAIDYVGLSRFIINELKTGALTSSNDLYVLLKSLTYLREKLDRLAPGIISEADLVEAAKQYLAAAWDKVLELQSLVPVGRINEELVKAYLSAK